MKPVVRFVSSGRVFCSIQDLDVSIESCIQCDRLTSLEEQPGGSLAVLCERAPLRTEYSGDLRPLRFWVA